MNKSRTPFSLVIYGGISIFFAVVLISCGGSSGGSSSVTSNTSGLIIPEDIPPGFGYPGVQVALQSFADVYALEDMRTHSWNLWGGMTSPSSSSYGGSVLPIWDTWCGTQEVFVNQSCAILSALARGFEAPTQHTHLINQGVATPTANTQVVSFNKYNPAMANYLMQPQKLNGINYNATDGNSLVALNASWPINTPIANRSIVQAPYTPTNGSLQGSAAIETKPVMLLIKAQGLTAMPLWRGPSDSWNPSNPTPETWKTCILLDPSNQGASSTVPVPYNPSVHSGIINRQNTDNGLRGQTAGCSSSNYLYAPIGIIYTFMLSADSAVAFNNAQGGNAVAGDYAAVVAMHVSTKEISNWTWQTFWWQPGADTPDGFPGSKLSMTDKVKGPWRNFAMCNAWSQTKGIGSNQMNVCFDPYLETSPGIPVGITSNCVSCHGLATVGVAQANPVFPMSSLSYPMSYTTPIDFNGAQFGAYTKLDFAWSIQNNASPPTLKTGK